MTSLTPHAKAIDLEDGPTSGASAVPITTVTGDGAGALAALGAAVAEAGGGLGEVVARTLADGRTALRAEALLPRESRRALSAALARGDATASWAVGDPEAPPRIALLVSREGHCALDLLDRPPAELGGTVVLVLSNHDALRGEVERRGVPFHHVPVDRERRDEAEAAQLALLAGQCDLVVLARYMQVLSPGFLEGVGAPVINVHHSLLPAFPGGRPYERAHARGVKLVGATAHYATEELDAGPIIEQDVARVEDRDGPDRLRRIGADVERRVLARAVRWHCQGRVVRDGQRTVVL